MTVTPLYTADELTEEITDVKAQIKKARKALSYNVDLGGSRRQIERQRLDDLVKDLNRLQGERVKLSAGHGFQGVQGRRPRG